MSAGGELDRALLIAKIDEAEQQLLVAEEELATAIRELRGLPRAEKTVTSRVIENAFEKLKVSRTKVSELKAIVLPDNRA